MKPIRTALLLCGVACTLAALPASAPAQEAGGQWHPRLDLSWNRYHRYEELLELMERMRSTWPDFVKLQDIGESAQGRPLRVMILGNQATGGDRDKVAMWVDGNVHGNEVQGGEAALYLAWWLLEHYDGNEQAHALLDRRVFYILPSQNPDGRDHWFDTPGTPHSSRTGQEPYDDDHDGVADEDGYDDLDGDGEILSMRKKVPLGEGDFRLDPVDPRIMIRVHGKEKGDWLLLGSEGIDNDGDGRINEDGPGGYDMNRNWPSDWQPNHIQYGAGDYPFSHPEPRAIGTFLLAHPNVAAVQSFHNSGGMILRGPGADYVSYPREDVRTYDAIGQEGETMLPFYRYMVIYKDLYSVHGGFVNWTYEGLGIFSFTNELWASPQYFGGKRERSGENWFAQSRKNQLDWNDSVMLGDVFVDWHPAHHPLYGDIEIGGFKRQHGRVAPSFMIEEMLHRNAMFCARHAEEIADLSFEETRLEDLGGGLYRLRAAVANSRTMPTRSGMAARERIGTPDRFSIEGSDVQVLSGGLLQDRWHPERFLPVDRDPARLLIEHGVPGHGRLRAVWLLRGKGEITLRYSAEKADDIETTVTLP